MISNRVFLLDKQNFTQSQWDTQIIEPVDNQVLLKVDRVALTSNNTTYAMLGQQMHYWDFFQSFSPQDSMGVLPVWGFAEVVESHLKSIEIGERYYGFWPLAQYALVAPEKVNESGFLDATPPKPNLPLTYRAFQKLNKLSPEVENFNAIFRPLGTTAYLLAKEIVKKRNDHGITQVIISSASSKTALATVVILKNLLEETEDSLNLIGLTSATNKGFVEGTKYFDDVVLYNKISSINSVPDSVYVDFSGSQQVQFDVHHHFNDHLIESVSVGATNWLGVTRKQSENLSGPTPYIFFAPAIYQEMAKQVGAVAVAEDIEKYMQDLVSLAENMTVTELNSEQDIQSSWEALLAGNVNATQALILRLQKESGL